jgi:sugar phosphate permease
VNLARFSVPERWRVTAFLFLAGAFNYCDRSAFSAVMGPVRKDMGLTDVQLGTVSALFLWTYGMSSPFAGNLADRVSRGRIVVLSLGLWSLFAGLTGFANGLFILCFLQISVGICESFFNPAAFALLADIHRPTFLGRAMSVVSLGCQLGTIAGGASAGWIAEHYGWRMSFRALGAGGIALALCAPLFRIGRPAPQGPMPAKPPAIEAIRYLVRVPSYYIILVKQLLAEIPTWVFFAWFPLYLLETFHMNPGKAGFDSAAILQVSVVFGAIAGGWISDVVARTGVGRRMLALALCYLVSAPLTLVFLEKPGLAAVAAAVAASSLLRGLAQANERPIMCEIVPRCFRATAFGVWSTCAAASGSLGIFAAGALKRRFGLDMVFASSSVLLLATCFVLLLGYKVFMARDTARAIAFDLKQAPEL